MGSPAGPDFYAAISTVSVAQICRSVGYTSAQPSTLRALSDIAVRYLLSIGRLCAASAASHNRTDCNLLDLVLSLETLYSTRGFSGGSDPTRPLLECVVLKELMAFVRIVDEIPFAKPIMKERKMSSSSSSSRSFALMGKKVTMGHVPRWLPCFPDSREAREKEEKEEENTIVAGVVNGSSENEQRLGFGFDRGLNLLEKREKIRFTIKFGSVSARGKRRRKNWDLAVD
ncbi:transcription initiation factor TFIID subunit 8-like [Carex rostrata]